MSRKTRYPYRDLGFGDYLSWIKRFAKWFGDQVGMPDYPTHLGDGLDDAIDDYHKAVSNWHGVKSRRGGKYKILMTEFKALRKQIVRLRIALPTIAPNPPILAEFGISNPVSPDQDVLKIDAFNCVRHWEELCDPDPPAEFLPVRDYFEELIVLFDKYKAAREVYSRVAMEAFAAQNELIRARKVCNSIERAISQWYRSRYPDTKDEFWTATDWGASRGRRGRPRKAAISN